KLSSRLGMLKVQAAQGAAHRARQVVLHERPRDPDVGITLHLKRLGKEASRIAKYFWLDDQRARNGSLDDVHVADDVCASRRCDNKSAQPSARAAATSTETPPLRTRGAAARSASSARGKMSTPRARPAARPAARSEARSPAIQDRARSSFIRS